MPVLIDSYSETNANTFVALDSDYADGPPSGQSFTNLSVPMAITSAKFWLKKSAGSPTGNIVAKLFAHSGTYGSSSIPATLIGSPLATSDPIAANTVGASAALYEFMFSGSNQYIMAASTHYCIVVDGSAVGNASNSVAFGIDSTSPTHSGNWLFTDNPPTSWSNLGSSIDQPFYVYGIVTSSSSGLLLFV